MNAVEKVRQYISELDGYHNRKAQTLGGQALFGLIGDMRGEDNDDVLDSLEEAVQIIGDYLSVRQAQHDAEVIAQHEARRLA